MSVTVSRDVFCDICGDWVHGCLFGTNQEARRAARQQGWFTELDKARTDYVDKCPSCLQAAIAASKEGER